MMQMVDPIVGPNIRSSDSTDFSEVPFGGWEGFWNAGVSAAENSIGGYIAREVGRGFDAAPDRPLTEIEKMTGGRSLWASPVIGDAVTGWLNPKGRMLTAEEANQKYSIGDLKFDGPISEIRASQLNAYARTELRRNQIIQQSQIGAVARFTASLLGGALDPVNWAALPVSEALLIRSGLTGLEALKAGSVGARAVYGGVTGFTSQALLEPAYQFAAAQEGREHGLATALQDLAFGTVLGGGLHAAFGPRAARVNPISDVIDNASHLEKYQLMRGAVGDVMEDRPVNVAPVIEALRSGDERIGFRDWFNGSKVVTEHGDPQIVYHGTRGDFQTFDLSRSGDATASPATMDHELAFFSSRPEEASGYAEGEAPGGNVRPVILNIKDPLEVSYEQHRIANLSSALDRELSLVNEAKKAGNDGVILRDIGGKKGDDVFIAFHEDQIRPAFERLHPEAPGNYKTVADSAGRHTVARIENISSVEQARVAAYQSAINDVAQSKLQPYQDPIGLQSSREANDAIAAAETPIKAREEDQGIGSASPIVREQDRLNAETQAAFDEFQKLGVTNAEDAAAIKAAQEAVKEGELLGKARDLAAQCLGEA